MGCFATPAGHAARAADPGRPHTFSAATLARLVPGKTTKAEVEKLLGQPWRTTFSDDADEPGPEIWEYRGKDAGGTYRVHIEFDAHGTATLVAAIPDKSGAAPARVASSPPSAKSPKASVRAH